jgi:hypothetical protein
MSSLTRIFSAAAILLFILPLAATSQSDRNHAIIEIKREAIISAHGNNQASGIRVLPGERYVGYRSDALPGGGRLINILDTIYLIKHIPTNPAYQTGETTNPNNHRAGLLRKPIITRLTKGGKEYYRLDVSAFKTYSDTVVIRTYAGSEILRFITLNQADIERSKIEPNPIIRISASGELTRFYDLPPYEEVEINRNYYQVFTREDNVECFWEKESGFLYELSGNQLIHIQTATEADSIVAESIENTDFTMYIGRDLVRESTYGGKVKKRLLSFDSGYFSVISNNLVYVLVVVILLILIIIVLFSYDWMEGVAKKYWQRLILLISPTLSHELNTKDTLRSLADKYETRVIEIIKLNPSLKDTKRTLKLKQLGLRFIEIPRSQKNTHNTSTIKSRQRQLNEWFQKPLLPFPVDAAIPKDEPTASLDRLSITAVTKMESEIGIRKVLGNDAEQKELNSIFASFTREMELMKNEIAVLKKDQHLTTSLISRLNNKNSELTAKIERMNDESNLQKQYLEELITENDNLREKLNQFLT